MAEDEVPPVRLRSLHGGGSVGLDGILREMLDQGDGSDGEAGTTKVGIGI